MMEQGIYDKELQMFRESPREADLATLRFMRWLIEQGKLEHEPAGVPSGEHSGEAA